MQPHKPDPANELFCLVCGEAIEQAELGTCPVEKEGDHECANLHMR